MINASRPTFLCCKVGILAMTFWAATGCASVPVRRWRPATRIDARLNPGWDECPPPFLDQANRLSGARVTVCDNPDAIARVMNILSKYERGWAIYWAAPPEPAPVELTFHRDDTWLGTLDVYPNSLGHVDSRVRRIADEDAVEILQTLCDCADRIPSGETVIPPAPASAPAP